MTNGWKLIKCVHHTQLLKRRYTQAVLHFLKFNLALSTMDLYSDAWTARVVLGIRQKRSALQVSICDDITMPGKRPGWGLVSTINQAHFNIKSLATVLVTSFVFQTVTIFRKPASMAERSAIQGRSPLSAKIASYPSNGKETSKTVATPESINSAIAN